MRFEQWSTFHEEMIGKRVREISTGDKGTVTSRRTFKVDNSLLPDEKIAVYWDDGQDLSISVDGVIFEGMDNPINPTITYQETTINGKRYKLVPIEE